MKKKNAQNPQQFQAAPPKRGMRLSTIIDVFMFITGILLTVMFFLPVYKDTVSYNKDFFKLDNLLGFFPDNAASYFGLAGKFLDDRNVAVTVMIFAFMFVMPILLAVLTFPKLRKLSGLAIIPIIVLVSGQFFFGAGFVIEQKALELAPIGFCYSVLIFQLPALYIIFIIQSIIEAGRLKKELKNAPNMGASTPAFGQPMGGQQFGPQGGFQPMNDQQFGPQGGFGQPVNDQQFGPQGGFGQPANDQQFGPQGGFGQPVNDQQFAPQGGFAQPANDQQFGPQNGFAQPAADQQYGMPQEQFQQAPAFEQPQNNFYSEAPVNEIPAPSYEENANEASSFDNAAEAAQNATENFEEVNETAGAASEAVDNGSDNVFDNSADNEADNSFGNVSADSSENVAGSTTEFESQAPVAETSNTAPSYAEPAPEATPEPAPFTAPAQEAQEPVKMQPAFCQHCGAKLEQGALFCMQCGAPIKA